MTYYSHFQLRYNICFPKGKYYFMKRTLLLTLLSGITLNIAAQTDSTATLAADTTVKITSIATLPQKDGKPERVYNIKPWLDIPITLAADAWSLYGMSVIYGRDAIPESEILGLSRNNVN